jgi:hypothetical protein
MDTLYLPYLDEDSKIRDAIDAMRQTDCRAMIVWHHSSDYLMYRNRAIRDAWCAGKVRCNQLDPGDGERVAPIFQVSIPAPAAPFGLQTPLYPLLEHELDQQQARYGILFPPHPIGSPPAAPRTGSLPIRMALIVTRHEGYAEEIANQVLVCFCTEDPEHQGDSPPLTDGDICSDCPGKYECV